MSKFITSVSAIFKPFADLVDNIHTSKEEKLTLGNALQSMQNQLASKVLELEGLLLQAQSNIITAEANGESWLQRNWRPITMLTFLVLIVLDSFGMLAFRLAEDAWDLLKIGLGGYVIGRSAEKIAPVVMQGFKK